MTDEAYEEQTAELEIEQEEGNDIELVGYDEGDPVICIVQKLLLTPKQQSSTQRQKIFRTCCTVNGKVCEVIVDGGSSENVVSKALVKALALKTEKHPSPYKEG